MTATIGLEKLDVSTLTEADVADIAARLEADEYITTSEELQDWHILRAIAFQRPQLAEPYYYLLDMESYDEA